MPLDTSNTVNFGFLTQDIRNQIAHSRKVVQIAENLKAIAEAMPQGEGKSSLERAVEELLSSANQLAANAEKTTYTATNTVSVLSRRST